MPDLDDLRAFRRVFEALSFTAAARDLGLGQSSVSRKVAGLEDELGGRLFDRTTRRLRPTDLGERLYGRLGPVLDSLDAALADVSEQPLRSTLRVAAPVSFAQLKLSRLLPGFLQAHPHIDVDLHLTNRFVDLVEQGVEVSIRIGGPDQSSVLARRLGEAARVVVASPDYLQAAPPLNHPRDLEHHPGLVFAGAGPSWTLQQRGQRITVSPPRRLACNHGEPLRDAALAKLGVTLVARWLVDDELASGELVEVLPGWRAPGRPVHALVLGPRAFVTANARLFIDWLRERFRHDPTLLGAPLSPAA